MRTIITLLLGITLVAFGLSAKQKESCPYNSKKGDGKHWMIDTNKDGKISMDEWMAHFNQLDKNKDKVISEEEMTEYHQNYQK